MAIESSLTQEIWGKKKLQLDYLSPESSLTQGDSDSESNSVSSSMQSSISSATSSLDQNSTNVNNGVNHQSEKLKKSISKRFATFGSFISSRRRAQSKLSQSSVNISDDSLANVSQSSSIEVTDESSNYVQKPMPKFTRTGSLRSVKILRSKSKNKSTLKSKKSSINKKSEISEESNLERATFSSILKDSKFPAELKHQPDPFEPEEVLPVAKICPYQHCSLHGHHHHNHDPPKKRFDYLKRRTTNNQKTVKPKSQPLNKSSIKKREVKVTKMAPDDVNDDSIEFYAKSRSEPVSSYGHDDAELADLLFGVNNLQETKHEVHVSGDQDSSYVNNKHAENSDGSKSVIEKTKSSKKTNHLSMWHMIHQHMVSGLEAENGDTIISKLDEEKTPNKTDIDDAASQETEIRRMFAIKLVRDAIEKILLPEVQDDQSTTSEVISEQDLTENIRLEDEFTNERKEKSRAPEEPLEKETKKQAPKRWSYLKKVILLTKFVKELEKVKRFNPRKPKHLPLLPEPEPETVSLRRQTSGDKKSSDEWMLDYALQKVVGELAPTQKRKVSLLIKAFETVAPTQDDPQESTSNVDIRRVGSETKSKYEDDVDSVKTTSKVVSNPDLEKEKHLKMWHMIYQHVATDIVTKLGSDLLDDKESTNDEEKDLQEVEGQNDRNYRLQFTQSDAVKIVRESVNEILLPEASDTSSQDSQSVASDVASNQGDENEHEKIEKDFFTDSAVSRLQQQKSKNWSKLKKLILLKRSIKALEGFRKLKTRTPQPEIVKSEHEDEKVDLRRQMMDERKKAEQWMIDYAVQHIVMKLTPARKKRVSMLVEAFEAVVPFPEI
ncbi:calmodulin binding protein PICBP-like [Rutidosis leptorrhynchoides]|uniref:calmodulin binding protein PICBP-like n=1 Tax=Rutidosis leptorrhynchoides TaxID=125765 RepID=UPI003A990AFD